MRRAPCEVYSMLADKIDQEQQALPKLSSYYVRRPWAGKRKLAKDLAKLDKRLIMDRALLWCFPWSNMDYPGVMRGALSLIPFAKAYSTISNWRHGVSDPPDAALVATAAFIRSRCAAGLALAAEIDAELTLRNSKPVLKRIAGLRQARKHTPK